eukprot:4150100-Amphidinium_carterae.1
MFVVSKPSRLLLPISQARVVCSSEFLSHAAANDGDKDGGDHDCTRKRTMTHQRLDRTRAIQGRHTRACINASRRSLASMSSFCFIRSLLSLQGAEQTCGTQFLCAKSPISIDNDNDTICGFFPPDSDSLPAKVE